MESVINYPPPPLCDVGIVGTPLPLLATFHLNHPSLPAVTSTNAIIVLSLGGEHCLQHKPHNI